MRRYLVVAHRTLGGAHLMDHLHARREEDPYCRFHLIVPQYHPQNHPWSDSEVWAAARERLDSMLETMAAMFLHGCGYRGEGPVYDPMSGSGTFVIEAAEIAAGLLPGRSRGFAFEKLAGFNASAFAAMQARAGRRQVPARFFGSDRDAGAVRMAEANTTRAGVADLCAFACHPAGDMVPPCPEPGLVIVNPPYGGRIGKPGPLFGLYAALGARLLAGFSGWRVGLVTSQDGLARETGLPWLQPGPIVAHGGLKVRLWRTGPI